MKKIYLMALAASLAVTTSAGNQKMISKNNLAPVMEKSLSETNVSFKGKLSFNKVGRMAGEDWTSLGQGLFKDAILCNMFQMDVEEVEVTIEKKGDLYKVIDPWGSGEDLILDVTNPDLIVIDEQDTGMIDYEDGTTYIMSYSAMAKKNGMSDADFLQIYADNNIYMQNDVIYMPADCVFFSWPDAEPTSPYYGEWFYGLGENSGYIALPGATPVAEWEDKGEMIMYNGILSALVHEEPQADKITVQVKKHNTRDGLWKIMNPFGYVISGTGKNLIVDVSDPDNVIVDLQSTGLSTKSTGDIYILSLSLLYDMVGEDIFELDPSKVITMDEDGNVVMPTGSILFNFPNAPANSGIDTEMVYDEGMYETTFQLPIKENSINVVGVENRSVSEYYNLQGVKIANPAKGQLVIVRNGEKVCKTIVR